jgi:hypothetical protein
MLRQAQHDARGEVCEYYLKLDPRLRGDDTGSAGITLEVRG